MQWFEDLLNTLQRRLGRYSIRNLMTILVIGMGGVYLLNTMTASVTGASLISWLRFDRGLILQGQVWRLLTFVFVPESGNMLFLALMLYFYWTIGGILERQWGAFRFNAYYVLGMLGAIIAGFITGSTSVYYLNMSLFLAFAALYPEYEVLVFGVLLVKMKWLALLDAISLCLAFFSGTAAVRVAMLFALANFGLFYGRDGWYTVRNMIRRIQWQRNWRR